MNDHDILLLISKRRVVGFLADIGQTAHKRAEMRTRKTNVFSFMFLFLKVPISSSYIWLQCHEGAVPCSQRSDAQWGPGASAWI